jgi:hypothetical protein
MFLFNYSFLGSSAHRLIVLAGVNGGRRKRELEPIGTRAWLSGFDRSRHPVKRGPHAAAYYSYATCSGTTHAVNPAVLGCASNAPQKERQFQIQTRQSKSQ